MAYRFPCIDLCLAIELLPANNVTKPRAGQSPKQTPCRASCRHLALLSRLQIRLQIKRGETRERPPAIEAMSKDMKTMAESYSSIHEGKAAEVNMSAPIAGVRERIGLVAIDVNDFSLSLSSSLAVV